MRPRGDRAQVANHRLRLIRSGGLCLHLERRFLRHTKVRAPRKMGAEWRFANGRSEADMAALVCPHCGASMPFERSWAQTAVATLIAAPAVPDMATQVRCPSCGKVSAAGTLRHATADRFRWPARALLVLVAVVLFWAVVELVGL